jgi:hypothetical protein
MSPRHGRGLSRANHHAAVPQPMFKPRQLMMELGKKKKKCGGAHAVSCHLQPTATTANPHERRGPCSPVLSVVEPRDLWAPLGGPPQQQRVSGRGDATAGAAGTLANHRRMWRTAARPPAGTRRVNCPAAILSAARWEGFGSEQGEDSVHV